MEFFDKKKDVIQLQLTRYGRQLLSIGDFKPVYYAFSDDGVLYDSRWISGTIRSKEEQWLVERRIQEETPRIKTLNSKVGTERTIFNTADLSAYALDQNIIDLFNLGADGQDQAELAEYKSGKLLLDPDFAESEKLLTNLLGSKRYFNNRAPAWNVVSYNRIISSSSDTYQKNDLVQFVPQINFNLQDNVYRVPYGVEPFSLSPHLEAKMGIIDAAATSYFDDHPEDEFLEAEEGDYPQRMATQELYDSFFEDSPLMTGSIFFDKDFVFVSFEEANVDFEKENFTLEVFEVTQTDEAGEKETLKKLYFHQYSDFSGESTVEAVENVLEIELDEEITSELACMLINKDKQLKTKNIYNTNVFDCEAILGDETSNNPYDLPPVDAEDVC